MLKVDKCVDGYLLTGICDCLVNQLKGRQFSKQEENKTTKGRKGKTKTCLRKWQNLPMPLISDQNML